MTRREFVRSGALWLPAGTLAAQESVIWKKKSGGGGGGGTIAFDSSDPGGHNGGSTNTLTLSLTVGGGSNRLLVLNLVGDSTDDDLASVTANGAAMTLAGKIQGDRWTYFYYLLNPSSGSNSVVITSNFTHYLIGSVASYSGVKQSSQPDAVATQTASTSSISTALTVVADQSWTMASVWGFNNIGGGAGTTFRQAGVLTSYGFFDSGGPLSPGSHNTVITYDQTLPFAAIVAVSFKPL